MTWLDGSSPHTRGALLNSASLPGRRRIIPAYAGSTPSPARTATHPSDHPRIRGEHGLELDDGIELPGSSPHTRGALPGFSQHRRCVRIIPAYAGSTCRRWSVPGWRWDHPRIRGEHARRMYNRGELYGSSPHTRGALCLHRRHRARRRIIPAYAGSTSFSAQSPLSKSDHPRIRGEHERPRVVLRHPAGSSPHTRGAQRSAHAGHDHVRIIPAYAGSTRCAASSTRVLRDHPRIRGEHFGTHRVPIDVSGSSPHTRGAPDRGQAGQSCDGIIPAYAGSTAATGA